jgi:hypothetical protein
MTEPTTPTPRSRGLEETARRAGGYAWTEMRLFELLGQWATALPEPAAAARLGSTSRHHGWRAELWHEQLPSIPALEVGDLVAPPDVGTAAVVATLADAPPGAAVEALASAYRVLVPRLVAAYDAHLADTSPVADGPVARTLRLVLADVVPDWIAGQRLLASLLTNRDAVERAAAQTARLELLLVEAPGGASSHPGTG